MSELVEECLGLIWAEKRGCVSMTTGKIAHNRHYWDDSLPVLVTLLTISCTPCSASLKTGTGKHIHEYHTQCRTVRILTQEGLSLGIGNWHIVQRLE